MKDRMNEMFKMIRSTGSDLNSNLCKPLKGRVTEKLICSLNNKFVWKGTGYDVLDEEGHTGMGGKGLNYSLFTKNGKKKKKTSNIIIKNFQGNNALKSSEFIKNNICSKFDELWIVDTGSDNSYSIARISSEKLKNNGDFKESADGCTVQINSEDLEYLCTPSDIDTKMSESEEKNVKWKVFEMICSIFEKHLQVLQ